MKFEKTARRLAKALNRSGLSQQQLADKSGVSKHSVSQYMNGQHEPSNISAAKMSTVLGVNAMWLMGYDVPMISPLDGSVSLEAVKDRIEQTPYYLNKDTAQIAQQIYDDPDLRALFDAARDVNPSNLKLAAEMLKRLKETNPDG